MSTNTENLKTIKIAIFEDDPDLRKMLVKMIEAKGVKGGYNYDISSYEDPSFCPFFEKNCKNSKNIESNRHCVIEGVRCSREEPCVDVIITDINMPNINGVDFIKTQLSNGCKVRNILFISGDHNEEAMYKISEITKFSGIICHYLHKPFIIQDLYRILSIFDAEMNKL